MIKVSYIVNQVCGSGLRAIVLAYQSLLLDSSKDYNCWWSRKHVLFKQGINDERWFNRCI